MLKDMSIKEKYKFIVIDDHPLIRDGIVNFIGANENFEFIGEFSDTRSVLNSFFPGRPDVIILDLNLPGIDGEKSCPLLKQKFPKCKIVAFTHYEGRGKELRESGFDGYVVKSERDLLIEALLTVLDGREYFKNNNAIADIIPTALNKIDSYLKIKSLTPREIEVAKYIIQDFSNREIGEKISIAESTVETHRKHIKEKLGAKNKRDLYAVLRNYEM